MKKLYHAYVALDILDYFEEGLKERQDKIRVVSCEPGTSEFGDTIGCYVLEAEEGVINSKYEITEKDLA